jgi:putative SOS response-associated peptidase YedK
VPVDSFYEWKKTGTGKQPYAIALADQSLMALAGLWENWRSPARANGCAASRSSRRHPNALCAELPNRMPVVLSPESWQAWLGEEPADARQLKALLGPVLTQLSCHNCRPDHRKYAASNGNASRSRPGGSDDVTSRAPELRHL